VPSASHSARLTVLFLCGALAAGSVGGCSTTQEKAERQRAQAKHILEARAKRQEHKHDKAKRQKEKG